MLTVHICGPLLDRPMAVDVEGGETVGAVGERVAEMLGVVRGCVKLVDEGEVLDNGLKMAQTGVCDGGTLLVDQSKPYSALCREKLTDMGVQCTSKGLCRVLGSRNFSAKQKLDITRLTLSIETPIDVTVPLLIAVQQRLLDVATLLAPHNDFNGASNTTNPLCTAIEHGHAAMSTMLLNNNANLKNPDHSGWGPLHLAAFNNDVDMVATLLNRGGLPGTVLRCMGKFTGCTAFHVAVIKRRVEVVRKILEEGSSRVNTNTPVEGFNWAWKGYAPVHLATATNDGKLLKILLQHGADPNKVVTMGGRLGFNALHLAGLAGHASSIKLLLQYGGVPDKQVWVTGLYHGWSALHCATRSAAAVETLLAVGADVDISSGGWTPLHVAVKNKHRAAVKVLLAHGGVDCTIKIREKVYKGCTPLDIAVRNKDVETASILKGFVVLKEEEEYEEEEETNSPLKGQSDRR